ncbi:serine hydrolase domain-containing protein [Maricaulis sp.]|uniref:serine hydrolase domain-containing protein n=1 Tax=Maricaulis sp. TaxID=1486257 RepID=UPI002B271DE8|nr:serine hydrolase domain-containing protein [Maricaulis sp.]
MRTVLAGLSSLLLAGFAQAQGPLVEDFEAGLGADWRGSAGRGDIQLTEYAGNHALRLRRNAWAARVVALDGRGDVRISVSFAALDLEGEDACLLEASDNGEDWQELGRIGPGQDDGLTLHRVGGALIAPPVRDWIAVRLRAAGNTLNDTCWADNLRVDARAGDIDLGTRIPAGDAPLRQPLSSEAFSPPADARSLQTPVSGRLSIQPLDAVDGLRVHRDEFGYGSEAGIFSLPQLEISVVGDGDMLIPVARGPQAAEHPHWEWIVEPGRVWQMPDGQLRAVMPVALQERNANCIHTGWLGFDPAHGAHVQRAALVMGAETCAYFQFDLWTRLTVSFEPEQHPSADRVRERFQAERANRSVRHPIEALQERFTGADIAAFGSPLEVSPDAMTVFGLLAGDALFAGGCQTRFGPDPYCESLPLPSYSLAKSMVASVALMRLERLYPGARSAHIADYVPACSAARWSGVTFEHALDMATGLYSSSDYNRDEDDPSLWTFMSQTTHADRIEAACSLHPRRTDPGEDWVYHTTDTYVLGAAMQAFWREQTGRADSDFYNDLLVPIWHEIGLSPLADRTRRTYDAEQQPVAGWGLTLHFDDVVRLAAYLLGPRAPDTLDPGMLDAALQRDPEDRGLPAGGETQRYQNGFWAWNAGPALGCGRDAWIPAMSGYGGITVALIPNGHVYAYASDGRQFAWRRAAAQSNALEPFCEVRP